MPLCCFVFGSSKASKRPPQRPEPQRRVSTAEGKAAEKKETTTVELTAVTSLQSADTAIQKPAPIQAGPTPAPTATSSAWRGVKDIAVNGLITALKVTKEATPIFPPLQSAAGGILAIIDVFQKMSSNKDDIEMLTRYLEKLGEFYKTVSASFPGDYKRACPEALRKRLEDFDREVPVREIEQDVRKLGAQALPAQLLNADDTAEEIDGFVRRLSMLVNNLVVGGTISIELAIDELQIVIIQGFDHMDDRFDGISDQIDGLGSQINQLLNESGAGLRYTIQARFDFHKSGRSACDSNTRREALATVYAWLRPDDPRLSEYPAPLHNVRPENPVFWINGLAGTGKSTLAQTIAHWCEDVDFLGATFFCARDGDRSNVSLIVPTIAHQLGSLCPAFRAEVSEAVKANPDIHGSLVSRQLQKLIVEPLRAVKVKESFPPCAIVIDALDECKDDEAVSVVLKGLALYVAKLAPLKFVITSRPIQRVTDGFSLENLIDHTQQFSLSTIPVEATKRDIANFLRTRLADIKRRYYVGGYWPSDQEVDELVELASELFIFAATAVKFVGDGRTNDPERQLVFLLRPSEPSSVAAARDSPYRYLDALYLQVLKSAFPKLDRRVRAEMKNILGTIALVQEQLHPGALEALLHLKSGLVRRTLRDVHSIIVVPPTDEEVIRVIHRSFADFIVDRDRCTESDFLVHSSLQHTVIANHCLQNLFLLRRDICQVRNESLLNIEIPDFNARVTRHIPPHLQYACKYWAYHLCHAELEQEVINHLGTVCRSYLLFWLEALSLLGSLDIAVEALQSSRNALQKLPLPPADVISILYDGERVVRFCYPAISASCFQAYKCALPFSPTSSLLRALFASQASGTVQVLSGLQKSWSPNIMAPEGHGGRVQCVGYSPNGERIVSCSEDVTIRLWDARTGTPLHVLEGHTARVCSVAFSPSGKQLLSGSDDLTVKLWDATTGSILGTWKRHSRDVRSVVWSSDGRYAASGSYDTTVVVWPVADPDDTTVFTEHIDEVDSIFFDSDGDLLSGSHDGTCKVWDVDRKTCKRTLTHPSPVMCVAGSRDSKIIASGCRDFTVTMWSKADGSRLHVLKQHAWWIWSLDFSPDNRTLASGSWDHTLCLWDVATGELLETLLGHADQVLTVKWSPDGKHIVTGECDHSVRIWECSAEILERGKPSKKRSSMKSRTNTLEKRTWEPSTGTYSSTGDHHVSTVRVVSFHPDGKLVATAAWDGTIRLWDVATGTRLKTLEGHKHLVTSVIWSRSGSLLCSTGDHDHTVRVWSAKTTKCVETFTQHTGGVWTCLFTHDERQVLSSSDDGTIRLWNIGKSKSSSPSGSIFEVLFQGAGPIYSLALSSNSKWVLSGSLDASPPEPEPGTIRPSRKPVRVAGTIRGPWEDSYGYPTLRLHDTSGHVLWMEHHTCTIASLAFSRDSTRALLGSQEGALFLYDLSNVLPPANSSPTDPRSAPAEVPTLRTFEVGDGLAVEHVSFSADERAIITDASYTPFENKLWPGAARSASASDSPVYFLLDGWLWRAVPELRRICWVPPTFRHFRQGSTAWRGNMAIRGHIVVFGTKHGQLVILDVSGC